MLFYIYIFDHQIVVNTFVNTKKRLQDQLNLIFLKQAADRLFGQDNYHWSAIGTGRMQFPICTTAAFMGGSCRVGLEDNLNLEKDFLAKSNADQVKKMVNILQQFYLKPATPSEAREILGITKT